MSIPTTPATLSAQDFADDLLLQDLTTGEGLPTLPAYDQACENRGNHSLHHLTGYDVIATVQEGPRVKAWIVASVAGADRYAEILEVTRGVRRTGEFTWAYPANRYACGCREAGRIARTSGVDLIRDDAA